MTSTITSYNQISSKIDLWTRSTAKHPHVALEAKQYLADIENVKSIDDFLKNDRLYAFAMKAHGLSDMIYAKAFIRKLLTEGIDSPASFANKLSDKRYSELAATFNFARYGETTTIFDRTRQGTVDRYVRQTLEENAGYQNENVRLALYFERQASTIKSAYHILADKALTTVTYTALGLAPTTSMMNIDAQANLITSRLNLADLKSPEKVSKFLARFASLADAAGRPGQSSSNPLPLNVATNTLGLGADVLLAVQSMRTGYRY